nr:MAG TPA: hypothetical protein [Caudoviricetes sp.]
MEKYYIFYRLLYCFQKFLLLLCKEHFSLANSF